MATFLSRSSGSALRPEYQALAALVAFYHRVAPRRVEYLINTWFGRMASGTGRDNRVWFALHI